MGWYDRVVKPFGQRNQDHHSEEETKEREPDYREQRFACKRPPIGEHVQPGAGHT